MLLILLLLLLLFRWLLLLFLLTLLLLFPSHPVANTCDRVSSETLKTIGDPFKLYARNGFLRLQSGSSSLDGIKTKMPTVQPPEIRKGDRDSTAAAAAAAAVLLDFGNES